MIKLIADKKVLGELQFAKESRKETKDINKTREDGEMPAH